MPTTAMPRVPSPPQNESDYVKQLADIVARFSKEIEWLLNGNLDVNNVRAKSITADRLKVQQLSAIAADLGTITAGIIYGAYIATSNGTFPRIEFSSVNKLLTAFSDALNHVDITTNAGGTPGVLWVEGGSNSAFLQMVAGAGLLMTTFGSRSISIQPGTDLNLSPSGSLKINGSAGYTGSVQYVKNVVSGTPTFGTITVTKGLITSVS